MIRFSLTLCPEFTENIKCILISTVTEKEALLRTLSSLVIHCNSYTIYNIETENKTSSRNAKVGNTRLFFKSTIRNLQSVHRDEVYVHQRADDCPHKLRWTVSHWRQWFGPHGTPWVQSTKPPHCWWFAALLSNAHNFQPVVHCHGAVPVMFHQSLFLWFISDCQRHE